MDSAITLGPDSCLAFTPIRLAFVKESSTLPSHKPISCCFWLSSGPRSLISVSLNLGDVPSLLLTVGDYAAEIEKATVGEEVYLPIFRAGLLLFLSGVISAFIAAAIVTKSGTWESLKDEFDEGKRSQYIYSELENMEKKKEADPQPVESKADDANVEGIDL